LEGYPVGVMSDLVKQHSSSVSGIRLRVTLLILLRCVFYTIFIFLLNRAIDFGTSPYLLSLGAVLGVVLASLLAFTRLRHLGFFALCLLIYFGTRLTFYIVESFPIRKPGWFFAPVVFDQHFSLILLAALITSTLAWLNWRVRYAATAEFVALLVISLQMVAGHRNFHFDSPRILNDLAWNLGVQQLTAIVILGASIVIFSLGYAYSTTLPYRVIAGGGLIPVESNRAKRPWAQIIIGLMLAIAALWLICSEIFEYYNREAATRTANGVGQESQEGVSPLDFHSALGSTNQPGALIRLEGDYKENPFSPMLYLRESALSQFNGHELVIGSGNYDNDVAGVDPSQSFKGEEDPELLTRVPLQQSIYLLTEHKLAFAVDYPISISQLKNPQPKRFKASYRAYSMAPAFGLNALPEELTGDSRWSDNTWRHYLEPHNDKRYSELAHKIADSVSVSSEEARPWHFISPSDSVEEIISNINQSLFLSYSQSSSAPQHKRVAAAKAFAITNYLSKTSIYTLTPNHEVKPDDDPVAPYLFGDKRGYCVHFAHATVYMLRSLGIPARIGTGYLTDLSQSRDGHILLRMSDRHAWAEVYIEGRGWLPFDTQPEQVESHADTQVDMKLLEELMGMLGPNEEILPSDIAKDEPNIEEPLPSFTPKPANVIWIFSVILVGLLAVKLYLRYAWAFAASPAARLKKTYRSLASYLIDLNQARFPGETRKEYQTRIRETLGFEFLSLTNTLSAYNYSPNQNLSKTEIAKFHREDLKAISTIPFWKRFLMFFNLRSIIHLLSRSAW